MAQIPVRGVPYKEGILPDATVIEAPCSTRNQSGERDPEMHQTRKGNRWRFGMKGHVSVAACTGLTHRLETTPANVHDLNRAAKLLHGRERFADAGYRGIAKRPNLKGKAIDWHIAERSGKVRALRQHPGINREVLKTEYLKASVRAKVEHPFRLIKCRFGFRRTRYRGLRKNDNKLATLFTLANLVRVGQLAKVQGESACGLGKGHQRIFENVQRRTEAICLDEISR